jgi:hypothetical protein
MDPDLLVAMESSTLDRWAKGRLQELFRHFPVVCVIGARQVGKTTLVHSTFPDIASVTFDPSTDIGSARSDPDLFLQTHPAPCFLDEIQFVPQLLSSMKRLVDKQKRPGMYLLSGSQQFSVLHSLAESMAGRVAFLELPPLARGEILCRPKDGAFLRKWISDRGDIQTFSVTSKPESVWPRMWRGGMPALIDLPDSMVPDWSEGYVRTYLERDLRVAGGVSDLAEFRRFLALLASQTAQEINATHLGRELGMDRKTALRWASLAEAGFQWRELPAFSRNAAKRIAGRPKGHMADTGLACHLLRIQSPQGLEEHPLRGALFETWVVQQILRGFQDRANPPHASHFRTLAGAEVDLVLEEDGWVFPVEVKLTARPGPMDARGLKAFRETWPDHRIAPGLLVCAVESPTWIRKDVLAVPWWSL